MCAPCKIILDGGGVMTASLRLFSRRAAKNGSPHASEAALYHADLLRGITDAVKFAVAHQDITTLRYDGSFDEAIDRLHAWSELCCHRAKALRADATASKFTASNILEWAEYDRGLVTEMFGGEYGGPDAKWQIVGFERIERKE